MNQNRYLYSLAIVLLSFFSVKAQTFTCYIANDHLVSSTQYDLDVYLIATGQDFNLRTVQNCISFNPAWVPGAATVTVTLVAGSSQLISYSIAPPVWSSTGSAFQTSTNLGSTCQTGTLITTTAPVRVGTFRLESTIPFNCVPNFPNMIIGTDTIPAGLSFRMALTKWNSTDCLVGGNTTITSNGTYSQYLPNTAYDSVNSMHPVITAQPQAAMNCATGHVTFSVTATPNPGVASPVSYQWLENGTPVSNGSTGNGTYSGATTSALTITSPTFGLNGRMYSCIVSQCYSDTTIAVLLTVANTNDNNVCTTDFCDSNTGTLTHTPLPGIDDNNACTTDVCNSVSGNISHSTTNTNDNNACTTDGCNTLTGVFHNTQNITDNNPCTIDACNSTNGNVTHNPVNADDGNACTTDGCLTLTGQLTHTNVNTSDNNACTVDNCDPGTGNISHTPVNPDDNNACTSDGCISTTGVFHTPANIDDGNACTTDFCNTATGIAYHPITPVTDNNLCTTDGCNTSTGIYHNAVNTNDGNLCTIDGCNSSTGIINHTIINFNDNNACTTDGCVSTTGVFNNPVNTNDNNACTDDACNTTSGNVTHTIINTNDNDACTTDGCNSITGVFHTASNINDNNSCTIDACNSNSGNITHTVINTNDNNACTTDGCDSNIGVYHNAANINDNDPCTDDACNTSTGTISHNLVNIDDNNACTTDACSSIGGVYHVPNPGIDDGIACTIDNCDAASGAITHTPFTPNAPTVTVTNNCGHSILTASNFTGTLLWNNSASATSIITNNAGTYTVTQTIGGCTGPPGSGTSAPLTVPQVNLGNDTTLLSGSVCLLDAGVGFSGYLWSTTEITQTISVTTSANYFVTVTGSNGCIATDSINVSFFTGIYDPTIFFDIKIFPNPASDYLIIENKKDLKSVSLEIYNSIGQLEKVEFSQLKNNSQLKLNVGHLPAGIYSLIIRANKEFSVGSFVKN